MTKAITSIFLALLGIILCSTSCKEDKKQENPIVEEVRTEAKKELPKVLYVIAPSGLILRRDDNLQSDQLAKMPYATKVEVLDRPDNSAIEVANISGNMINIKFNSMSGFAYNGYLSRFKVPNAKEKSEDYAKRLQVEYPEATFSTENKEENGAPATSVQLSIPAGSWSEAFLVAKQLFDISTEYNFPGLTGLSESSIKSRQEHGFTSTLDAKRSANDLTSIKYIERAQRLSRIVHITKEDNFYILQESVSTK
ncbi:SH3 domain-containing protein [Flavimarina sp. Hel_I_48]|uniref:SH3 domain-containing protein n=1 Tax=Flavimarina sp. Hel_I_48 TaxID=1392488 RepID=UPI0004DF4AEC|nr:SH3 domain-containing protein [Flavimarina sp. Hel_I_48]